MPPSTPQFHSSNSTFESSEPKDTIWYYFRDAIDPEDLKDKANRKNRFCLICFKGKFSTGHKSNARSHLKCIHLLHIPHNSEDRSITISTQSSLEDGFIRARLRQSESVDQRLIESFNQAHFLELQTLLIVRRHLPFKIVQWPEYRALLQCVNPAIKQHLISSPTTVSTYIKHSFIDYRKGLVETLSNARSIVHLSSDMWTSPNRLAFLGITAQWIDQSYNLRHCLLALSHVQFNHSGDNQASHMLNTIKEYGIEQNLGYYVGDNASSNDTCMRALSKSLHEEFKVGLNE